MPHTVSVLIPDDVYQQVETEANSKQETVAQTISTYLVEAVRKSMGSESSPFSLSHEQRLMQEEMAAFERMHRELVKMHLGKWVAIYKGKLVDSDWNAESLLARRIRNFPKQTVLIDKVEVDRQPDIFIPSIRLEEMC